MSTFTEQMIGGYYVDKTDGTRWILARIYPQGGCVWESMDIEDAAPFVTSERGIRVGVQYFDPANRPIYKTDEPKLHIMVQSIGDKGVDKEGNHWTLDKINDPQIGWLTWTRRDEKLITTIDGGLTDYPGKNPYITEMIKKAVPRSPEWRLKDWNIGDKCVSGNGILWELCGKWPDDDEAEWRTVSTPTDSMFTDMAGRGAPGLSVWMKKEPLEMTREGENGTFMDNRGCVWECRDYDGPGDRYKMFNRVTKKTLFFHPTGYPVLYSAGEPVFLVKRVAGGGKAHTVQINPVQSGKTEQMRKAAESAESEGVTVVFHDEPGDNGEWNCGDFSVEHEENTTSPLGFDDEAIDMLPDDKFGKEGPKYDGDKSMVQLLPPQAVLAVGHVLRFGAQKYEAHSWHRVPNAEERYVGAGLRHILAHLDGEVLDSESGLPHLAHGICSLMFVLELHLREQAGRERDGSKADE